MGGGSRKLWQGRNIRRDIYMKLPKVCNKRRGEKRGVDRGREEMRGESIGWVWRRGEERRDRGDEISE